MSSAIARHWTAGPLSGAFKPKLVPLNSRGFPGLLPKPAGFTLIEMLLILSVVAIIIGIGASSFISVIPKYRLQAAVWEVSAKLNEARYTAVLKGTAVRMRFADSGYCLEHQNAQDGTWLRLSGRRLEGVSLRANNAPVFYPQGTVSNLATIWVENGFARYRITLAITGRVKVTKG